MLDDSAPRLSPHETRVLAALAVAGDGSLTVDQLSEAVWGAAPPASWHKNLQTCVVRLRKVLGHDAIETTRHGYRLTLAADAVDARRFEALVTRGHELLELGEDDRAAYLLHQALAFWRGRPYTELEDWGPGSLESSRLSELRLDAQEWWLEASVRTGRHREILAQAQVLADAAPLRERRWALLALAQYRAGAQAESLRTIRRLRTVLVRELGIDPGPEVAALEQSILRQDPSLVVPAARHVADRCPWQGLRAYDVGDAERFFGRDDDVLASLAILGRSAFLALVGPSGCGKSSLMRAGVLSALRRRGHQVVLITPGHRPMEALAALPRNAPPSTALAVDQAEEVFALCEDVDERRAFLERLADEARRRPVVVTVRGDRLTQATEHAGFSRLVEQGLHLVGALDEAGLRDAVERPAHQAGLVVESGLVELLVREVRDDPGALPLLSHALLETWQRREGNTLTVDGYRASGGIHGAVAQSAERLYGQVEPDQRRQLRDLILRLVSPGVSGEAVRAQVPRRLIASDRHHEQLIEMLVGARLVTSDQGVLEITHEAIARAWPRLRGWLEDDVEGQRTRRHLSAAADAWDTLGRPDSELYRGVRLSRALDWQSRTDSALTATEREFLFAAQAASAAEERGSAERARVQARLIRRLRIVLSGAAVVLVLALVAGGIAAAQSDRAGRNAAEAQDAAETARRAAVSADARRVGGQSQLTDDITLSLLLAAAGSRLEDSPETRVNLLAALAKRPQLARSAPPGGGFLALMDVSRDGRWIAASDNQNRMHLYDASTNRLLRTYDVGRPPGDENASMIGAFSPDSEQLAVIGEGSTDPVRLLDPNTMQTTTTLDFPGGKPVWGVDVRFSGDGRYLAATANTVSYAEDSNARAYAVVWDLRSPSAPPVRLRTGTSIQEVALSPDGRVLYTAWPLTAYDVVTGEQLWRREQLRSFLVLDVNAEGTLLALGDAEAPKDVLLVDAATGETVHTLRGHRDSVSEVRFSPDGSLVGSAARGALVGVVDDGAVSVWDTATGRPLERLDTFDPWGIGFSPDNDLVYGGGGESMLRTWDMSGEDTYLQQTTQVDDAEVFAHADFSPDGQKVAYSWLDGDTGWVKFVDTVTGAATPPARAPVTVSPWASGAWDSQGEQYVAFCTNFECAGQPPTVLDPATGEVLAQRQPIDGAVWSIDYVDGNRSLLVGGSDVLGQVHGRHNRALVVDAQTLRPRGEPLDVTAHTVIPIGDGSTAMLQEIASDFTSVLWRVIDVSTGDVLSEGEVDQQVYAWTASPDGSTVAVAGDTGEIVIIDVSTGAEQQGSIGLGAPALWLDFSGDGKLLVASTDDGGVSLWDATTLDPLGTVYAPHLGKPVQAGAQFIGDTHDVAIASHDGKVYRWETDIDRAIDFACQMAGRTLTNAEWADFLPAQPYQSVCPHQGVAAQSQHRRR